MLTLLNKINVETDESLMLTLLSEIILLLYSVI